MDTGLSPAEIHRAIADNKRLVVTKTNSDGVETNTPFDPSKTATPYVDFGTIISAVDFVYDMWDKTALKTAHVPLPPQYKKAVKKKIARSKIGQAVLLIHPDGTFECLTKEQAPDFISWHLGNHVLYNDDIVVHLDE